MFINLFKLFISPLVNTFLITSVKTKIADLEKLQTEEKDSLANQLAQYKEAMRKDRTSVMQDSEKLRRQLMDLDRELSEVQANYDRDKELWAGKFQFLEQQRDQARGDFSEAQKKFEMTLEQLQKRGTMDKDKLETNQMALISSLELRHKNQIKEMNEVHQHLYSEIVQKNKQLEKELKYANDKLQIEQRGKLNENSRLEKKVADLQDVQTRLSKELEEVKADRDRKILEYQRLFEKERDGYKAKLHEAESRFSETDTRKASLVLEFEKERAKWSLERDHLTSQKNEAHEIIERLEKKKESLLLENDKLKSERTSRKPLYSGVNSSLTRSSALVSSSISGKFKENHQMKYIGGEEKHDPPTPSRYPKIEMGCSDSAPIDMVNPIGGVGEGGVDQIMYSMDGLSNPVEFHISCQNIPDLDTFSKSDPMALVYLHNQKTGQLELVGHTEAIENSDNPIFVQHVVMRYCFEERQKVHIKVVDIDDRKQLMNLAAHDLVGTVDFFLSDALRAPHQTWKASLIHPTRRNNGTITIHFEEHKNKLSSDIVRMVVEADISTRRNNFFRLLRLKENSVDYLPVFQSESATFFNSLARWKPVKVGSAALMKDNPNYPLRIEFFSYVSNGNHQRLGQFDFTFANLVEGSLKFSGSGFQLRIKEVELQSRGSFMDYLFGGMNISLTIAIDFTASNGDPKMPHSLHYIYGRTNQYLSAINSVGSILLEYDTSVNI